MSTEKRIKIQDCDYVTRFKEFCGSSDAKVISDYLGVSNQAARNYLNGRIPDAKMLIKMASKTPVSIHWLLTGEGDKFVDQRGKSEAEMLVSLLADKIDPGVMLKMVSVMSEERLSNKPYSIPEPETKESKVTVKIPPRNILYEKEPEETAEKWALENAKDRRYE